MGAILCSSEKDPENTMATTVQTQRAAQQYEASVEAAIQRLKERKYYNYIVFVLLETQTFHTRHSLL